MKEIFLCCVANGDDYPSLNEPDFNAFVQEAEVLDENLRFVDL
jgi:hypothetical protein